MQRRTYEAVRRALVQVLTSEGSGVRLKDLRQKVEERLGKPVNQNRFKDYVNSQTRGANPLLERLGYGTYRLRS